MQERFRGYKTTTYALAALTALILTLTWFINQLHDNYTSANPRVHWLQENYVSIIVVTMLVSIAAGYSLSTYAYRKLTQTSKKTQELRELLYIFLDTEEKIVLDYLLQEGGSGEQASISRLDGMTRVKAHRTIKKMQEKDLLEVKKHGKINKVHLPPRIQELLN